MTDAGAAAEEPVPVRQEPEPGQEPRWVVLCGYYGVAAILSAYALVSFGLLSQGSAIDHLLYQSPNLSGAVGIGVVCVRRRAWQALALNVVWVLIAASSLWRLWSS